MPFNSDSYLAKKIREKLLSYGYHVAVQPTIDIDNNPALVDFSAATNSNVFLIEVNNGIRVGLNDISQLVRYSKELKKREHNKKIKELIITDKIEKIDPEVLKISDEKKIKIITYQQLKDSGLISSKN